MKNIPFSNNTNVLMNQRRMVESTVVDSQCLMMLYVWYLSKYLQPCEEMLFIEKLLLDSKGFIYFHSFTSCPFEHNNPFEYSCSCIWWRLFDDRKMQRFFTSPKVWNFPTDTNCLLLTHRQHFVAKNMKGATVRNQSCEQIDRIFCQPCLRSDEVYTKLFYPTEVQWRAKAKCIFRFVELFQLIISFFEETRLSTSLMVARYNIDFLCDVFTKLN